MNANILILATFVVILCRIRYALKKVHSYENDMDIRILEISQTDDDDDMKTISDDLTDSENEIITEEDLHMLPLDYETDDEYVYDNLECNDELKSEAKTNLDD